MSKRILAKFGEKLPDGGTQLGNRIKTAADAVGGLTSLADLVGLPRRTLADYASGSTEPKASALALIAIATRCDLNWLIRGQESLWNNHLQPQGDSADPDMIVLPRFDVAASAGAGSLVVTENIAEHFSVGRDWLRRNLPPWAPPNALVGLLEGAGDSMEPTIRDGDLVMVVQEVDWRVVERGGIFVLTVDHDRLLLKRLQVRINGDLDIISDNPAYAKETIPKTELHGRVIIHAHVFFAGGKPRGLTR